MKRITAKRYPFSLKGRHFPMDLPIWEMQHFEKEDAACLPTQLYFLESQTEHFKPKSKQELEAEKIRQEFENLVKVWKKATSRYSIIRQKIIHPAYLRIIGMSEKALPLILEELKQRPSGSWFPALEAITGENAASTAKSIEEAIHDWLNWGKEKQYLNL